MERQFEYQFEWDPAKALRNDREHLVSFERAAAILLDPRAMSVPDDEHGEAVCHVPGGPERSRTVSGTETMKPHYDFSKAERGKFYRKGARVRLPIYLDGHLQKRLESIAQKKGRDVGDVVSDLLIKGVELLEEMT